MTCSEVCELLPAYSLDALELDERDEVDDHLARCPACAAELGAFADTAARLALALPDRAPSKALKARLLAAASGEAAPRLSWWRSLSLPRLRYANIVAGLALLVAVTTSVWAAGLQVQVNEQREMAANLRDRAYRYEKVVAVLQSSDVQLRPLRGTENAPSAIGRIYVDPDSGNGMMAVRAMPPLHEGRAYQLWWVRADGRRESGGLLTWTDPQGNGYTFIQCPAPYQAWAGVGITEEPANGSPAPTGPRMMAGSI